METYSHLLGTLIPYGKETAREARALEAMKRSAREAADEPGCEDLDAFDTVFFYDTNWIEDPMSNDAGTLDHGGRGFVIPDPWEALFVLFNAGITQRSLRRIAYGMGCVRETPDHYVVAEVWPDVRQKATARGLDFPFTKMFTSGYADAEKFLMRLYEESDIPSCETRIETRQSRVLAEKSVIREVLLDRRRKKMRPVHAVA